MRLFYGIIVLMLLLPGCRKNTYILPEDQFVNVIVDLHLAEGIVHTNNRLFISSGKRYDAIEQVFELRNIDRERFDSTLHYYAKHPQRYDAVYDRVLEKLLMVESSIRAGDYNKKEFLETRRLIYKEFQKDTVLSDSVYREIWWGKRDFDLPVLGKSDRGNFERTVGDTVSIKAYLLLADIRLKPKDCSLNPRFELFSSYENGLVDSVFVYLPKDSILHTYSLYLRLTDSVGLTNIFGAFLEHDSCESEKSAEFRNVRLYEIVDTGHPLLDWPVPLIGKQ